MRIAVLGAGAWGTALAQVFSERGHDTQLWTWLAEHATSMEQARENLEFLPGVPLSPSLRITSSMQQCISQSELVVVVVPSHAVRSTMALAVPHLQAGTGVVCASKGIEQGSLMLMTEVLESLLEERAQELKTRFPLAVLSGPSFAKEVARGVPTNLVAASSDAEFSEMLQEQLSAPHLRVYTSPDPLGVEIGGALKNVIAIAAGACDGLGLGQNTRAALITRGVAEMSRLVAAKGGRILTMAGLAGMGDLVLTCTGEMSRNRTLGFKLGSGVSLEEALASSAGVAEGYVSAKSAHDLAVKLGVDMPICEAVYSVLYGQQKAKEALQSLLSRPLKAEWE